MQLHSAQLVEAMVFHYKIVPVTGLVTVIATNDFIIEIPDGKCMKVVSLRNGYSSVDWSALGSSGHWYFDLVGRDGFGPFTQCGPLQLQFHCNSSGDTFSHITYSLIDSSVLQLPSGVISTTGTSALSVEKSNDLTNWFPAAIMLNHGSPQSTYRLKAGN